MKYGLSTTDALIKTAVELTVEDLRKHPWVIEQMFSSYVENPILAQKYGWKEIARAKEFILNNKINFYQKHRNDSMDFPCVTIALTSSSEDSSLATLGDVSHLVNEYTPEEIDRPIAFVVKPTQMLSYDADSGIVEIPENESYRFIEEGMNAINPATGVGYKVLGKAGVQGFRIQAGLDIDWEKVAVIPQYLTYRARQERIISKESYSVGCHAQGDPSLTLYLYTVVKYALLRYRETMFEQYNFQLGTISASDTVENDAFQVDKVFSRFISLNGQVEEYWVKTPYRKIESIDFVDRDYVSAISGIKIISNETTQNKCDVWNTVKCKDEE